MLPLPQYPNCCVVLVLVRDSGSGRVVIDRSGRPRIHYSLAPKDEESMLKVRALGSLGALGSLHVYGAQHSGAAKCTGCAAGLARAS